MNSEILLSPGAVRRVRGRGESYAEGRACHCAGTSQMFAAKAEVVKLHEKRKWH